MHWFGPPHARNDLAPIYAALSMVERLFPTARFDHTHVNLKPVPMPPDRDAWIAEQMNPPERAVFGDTFTPGGRVSFVDVSDQPVVLRCSERLGPRPSVDGQVDGVFTVEIFVTPDRARGMERTVMTTIGDAFRMWHGTYDPGLDMYQVWNMQMECARYEYSVADALGFDLPLLYPFQIPDRQDIPHSFGWLNYWSSAMCEFVGFPHQRCDQEWLARGSRSSETGAWLFALSDGPWDRTNPDHVAALQRAWARFDRVGVREPPEDDWRDR